MINSKTFRLKCHIIIDGNEPGGITAIDGRIGTMVTCNEPEAQLCAKLQEGVAAGEHVRFLVSTYGAAECGIVRFLERLGK